MRAVMNGVMYILSTGCQWRYLPKDFSPRSAVHNYFVCVHSAEINTKSNDYNDLADRRPAAWS
jgi:transposase